MADIKHDMAILATSGREWSDRTKRLAARVPDLDIFSQGLVERLDGGWLITDKGRAILEIMEARTAFEPPQAPEPIHGIVRQTHDTFALRNQRRQKRRRLRRAAAAKRTSSVQEAG